MVRPVRFELTATALKERCSTVELRTHYWKNVDNLSCFLRLSRGNLAGDGFEPPIFTLWAWRDWPLLQPAKFKERWQSTILSPIVKGDFAETSNCLEHPAASKERDHFTILSAFVKGFLDDQKLLPSWYLCLLAYLPFPLFLPL